MIKLYVSGEYAYAKLREVTFGAQDYEGDFHYNMFTTSSLTKLLEEAGLSDVDIIREGDVNGDCFEFELSGIKKG